MSKINLKLSQVVPKVAKPIKLGSKKLKPNFSDEVKDFWFIILSRRSNSSRVHNRGGGNAFITGGGKSFITGGEQNHNSFSKKLNPLENTIFFLGRGRLPPTSDKRTKKNCIFSRI